MVLIFYVARTCSLTDKYVLFLYSILKYPKVYEWKLIMNISVASMNWIFNEYLLLRMHNSKISSYQKNLENVFDRNKLAIMSSYFPVYCFYRTFMLGKYYRSKPTKHYFCFVLFCLYLFCFTAVLAMLSNGYQEILFLLCLY